MSSNTTSPRFISTEPLGKDLFESRSQENVAISIEENLTKQGFRIIGLDGEYGAGKSNVISILKQRLQSSHHFFIYDAWSHQEDLQRRTFLEELTDNLATENVVNETKWTKKLTDLLAKKRDTITQTIPKISPPFYYIAGAVFLMPVAKEIADLISSSYPFWKIIVTAAPILLLFLAWGIAAKGDKKYRDIQTLFLIYKEKDLHKTVNETISEKEPSVREFRKWMKELSGDLTKNLVIVFDNMDRLPKDKVKALWSAIHTFFSEGREQYNNISVIVPFDRVHLSEAFKEAAAADPETTTTHFINKTFPIIFNVAPVVLTEWKKFFNLKYQEAFGNTEDEEYTVTEHIFDLYNDSITPRQIISFINGLVSLQLIWKGAIKMRYMAVYLLSRKEIQLQPLAQIVNRTFASKAKVIFEKDDALPDNIAALFYNVPITEASQVTLYRQIQLDLRNKQSHKLKDLAAHPHFNTILKDVISKVDIDIENAAITLNEFEDLGWTEKDKPSLSYLWGILANKQLAQPFDTLRLDESQKIILVKNAHTFRGKQLVEYLIDKYYNSRDFKGGPYFNVLQQLESFLAENTFQIDFLSLISNKIITAEEFLDYVKEGKETYKKFKVSTFPNQLDELLLNKLTSDKMQFEEGKLIGFIKDNYDLPKTKAELERRIRDGEMPGEKVGTLFRAYQKMVPNRPLTIALPDNILQDLLTSTAANTDGYYELVAIRMARGAEFPTVWGGVSMDVINQSDEIIVKDVAQRIEYYKDLGNLILDSITWPQPLLKTVIQELVKEPDAFSLVNHVQLLRQFDDVVTVLNYTPERLMEALDKWTVIEGGRITTGDIENIAPAVLTIYAQTVQNTFTKSLQSITVSYLQNISTDDWAGLLLKDASVSFHLLINYLKNDLLKSLPDNVMEAYKISIIKIAKATDGLAIDKGIEWKLFYDKADKLQLDNTVQNIRDEFINGTAIIPEKFLFFEEMLHSLGALQEKPTEVVRKILLPIIDNNQCLQLIIANSEIYLNLLASAGNQASDIVIKVWNSIERGSADESTINFARAMDKRLFDGVKIKEAKYYAEKQTADVTDKVRYMVEKEKVLHFQINNALTDGYDIEENVKKRLYIHYEYLGKETKKTWDEGFYWHLPF